jgi:hypothetical protein
MLPACCATTRVEDLELIWERMPDSGYRFELDEGVLVVFGAPGLLRQIASSRLTTTLTNACPPELLVIITPDADKPDVTAYQLAGTDFEQVAYAKGKSTFTAARPFPVSFTPEELTATR